jgi:hypothetical protein
MHEAINYVDLEHLEPQAKPSFIEKSSTDHVLTIEVTEHTTQPSKYESSLPAEVEEESPLAPKQEQIEIDDYFEPETVRMMVGDHFQITGQSNGLDLAYLDNKLVIVERCRLSLQQIDCLNCSSGVCKIQAVIQVDHNNPQIATKIAIENPLAASDAADSLMSLLNFIETRSAKPG